MSQRRSNSKTSSAAEIIVENEALPEEEDTPFVKGAPIKKGSLSIETADEPASLDERYQIERHRSRIKHWQESPFAVGLVQPTWKDERLRTYDLHGDDEIEKDETGCLCCSALVCPLLGASRVGNMVVLRSSHEWVEEVTEDEETGETTSKRYTRPRLDCVVGPYWPMMLCVTYPLILGVSGWAFFVSILPGRTNALVTLVWFVLTTGLITALAFTACCDPGILYKYPQAPPQYENIWRWSDRAHTYRPPKSFYDVDTAVVVEGFDHTCPWTGTAIGKRNMCAFQAFVSLVFVCMLMDIFVITGVLSTY